MIDEFACPHGHRWEAMAGRSARFPSPRPICPVCGDEAETLIYPRPQAALSATTEECSPPVAAAAPPAQVGGYEILGELGRGGMGVVYKARQRGLNRLVALKMILSGAHAGSHELSRFRAEAETIARLQHVNLVQIHDIAEEEGRPYFAMEFVDGGSLAQKLSGSLMLPAPAARLLETLARAVHAAHEKGIVHRDLKPSNILLMADGTPKIGDFGLSKRLDGDLGQTRSGEVLGTPAYMAPEQAAGRTRDIGPTTDVYALGVILYQALTGRLPFQGCTLTETLDQVRTREPIPPRRLQRRVPRDLETICLKCLDKDPRKRYARAADLADDLARFREGQPVRARRTPLWERGVKWTRRRPVIAALMGVILTGVLALAAAALWYWDARYRVKVDHYAAFARRWHEPIGIGPVTESEARHRHHTYKLYRKAGRVIRMEIVNGSGHLTAEHDDRALLERLSDRSWDGQRECRYDYEYDERGKVLREIASNRAGRIVWTLAFTSSTTAHYADERGFPRARTASGATYIGFEWTPEGYPAVTRCLGPDGQPRPTGDHTFGIRQEFNAQGLPVRRGTFDALGQPMRNEEGYAGATFGYDERGNLMETTYSGIDGRPAANKYGVAQLTQKYDGHGNLTERAFVSLDGQPALDKEGFARWTQTFDARGNRTEIAYFGTDGRPALHKTKGMARYTYLYDARGNPIEIAIFDSDGRPTLHKLEGMARWTLAHDERDNMTEVTYFGIDGQPTLHKQGFARRTQAYDARGNEVERAFFGLDGRPTPHTDGYAKFTLKYDERDNVTESATFGIDGRPTLDAKTGAARWTRTHDARGNVVEVAYFGLEGQPTLHKEGYAKFTRKYDEHGNHKETAFFGVDGRPTLSVGGFARWTETYDVRGKVTETAYFGLDGQLTLLKVGFARKTQAYDARGYEIERAFFGLDGRPALDKVGGVARWTQTIDAHGNLTERAFFGLDGRPMLHKEGYAKGTRKYDERGNVTEVACFGTDGRLRVNKLGYARQVIRYDDRDAKVDVKHFDAVGRLLSKQVVLVAVLPGTQAERLGLRAGDAIQTYDGREIGTLGQFNSARKEERPSDNPRELKVRRGAKEIAVRLAPGTFGARLSEQFRPIIPNPNVAAVPEKQKP